MELFLTFTESQHAIEIEDAMEEFGYTIVIIRTPNDLIEMNPFFCKTTLKIVNPDTRLFDRVEGLPVAGLFQCIDEGFVSVHPILERT